MDNIRSSLIFLYIICLAINYHLVMKKIVYLNFDYISIQSSSSFKEIQHSLKMATTIQTPEKRLRALKKDQFYTVTYV